MPFFLHELYSPEPVYDGKLVAAKVLQKMLYKSSSVKLTSGKVYDLSPNPSEESLMFELVIVNEQAGLMRIRRNVHQEIAMAYRMNRKRKVELIFEPEIHYLGTFIGGENLFPIVDDTEPELIIRRVISCRSHEVLPKVTKRKSNT